MHNFFFAAVFNLIDIDWNIWQITKETVNADATQIQMPYKYRCHGITEGIFVIDFFLLNIFK
jgi:hypothetical protein